MGIRFGVRESDPFFYARTIGRKRDRFRGMCPFRNRSIMVWEHQYTKAFEFVLCCKDGTYYLAIYLFNSQHLFMNVALVSSLIRGLNVYQYNIVGF